MNSLTNRSIPPTDRGVNPPVSAEGARPPRTNPSNDHRIQSVWLYRARGRPIRLRLLDGKVLRGVLRGYDTFALEVALDGQGMPCLVYKQGVAYACLDEGQEVVR